MRINQTYPLCIIYFLFFAFFENCAPSFLERFKISLFSELIQIDVTFFENFALLETKRNFKKATSFHLL